MIPLPADRDLARTYVATMKTPGVHGGDPEASEEQLWEFSMLLIAVARRAGWTPPVKEP